MVVVNTLKITKTVMEIVLPTLIVRVNVAAVPYLMNVVSAEDQEYHWENVIAMVM